MPAFITEYPQFFTASIKGRYKLLQHDPDSYRGKDIIINSLRFLVEDKRIKLYVFAIMSDHIHLTCLPAGRYGKCNHWFIRSMCKEIFWNTQHNRWNMTYRKTTRNYWHILKLMQMIGYIILIPRWVSATFTGECQIALCVDLWHSSCYGDFLSLTH